MFICSICNETLNGANQDTSYSTLCGHVFHQKCLMTWLQRSKTCPHCRSKVTEDNVVKLFLQNDPNVTNHEDELKSLGDKLTVYIEKDRHNGSFISVLRNQLFKANALIVMHEKSIHLLNHNLHQNQKKFMELNSEMILTNEKLKSMSLQKSNIETQIAKEQSERKAAEKHAYELQSVNSVVVNKLRIEIAGLKAEKSFFQNKCQFFESKMKELPSTSKVEKEVSLQTTMKHEFVGPDPNIKLSSKKCLLGCIFLIVGGNNMFDQDMCSNASMMRLTIIDNGGWIENTLTPRVTHIIGPSQKDELVLEGIRTGKRCVTEYWLTDTVAKKNMLTPWLAHHFPTPYCDKTELPCQNMQLVIVNFDVNEYQRVKAMISLTGACVSDNISSDTDVVISLNLEGELVSKALALKRPVVNVQWLNDILLGARIGIANPNNIKYQQFDLCDPFSVNYDMVPHLMEVWKTPFYDFCSHIFDLTKSPTRSSKRKRQSVDENEIIDLVDDDNDDDDDDDDVVITDSNIGFISNYKTSKPCVVFCDRFTFEDAGNLERIVLQLGGRIACDYSEATHLVMKEPSITVAMLCCLSTVSQIVNEDWLKKSSLALKFLDEKAYSYGQIFNNEALICDIPKVLTNPMRSQLFKGLVFFVTSGIVDPPSLHLEKMIVSAGGIVEPNIRSVDSIQELSPKTYFIISSMEDLDSINDLLEINDVIYTSNFIINSIVRQCVDIQNCYQLMPRT